MGQILLSLSQAKDTYVNVYLGIMRFLAPALALFLLWRCLKPLLTYQRVPEIWAWLTMDDGSKLPLTHWENVVGRRKDCDVQFDDRTVSRNHAVLTRYDDGSWTVTDADSKAGVYVNGQKVQICALEPEDQITIGSQTMTFSPITVKQEALQVKLRTKAGTIVDSLANLLLLTVFQGLCCLSFVLGGNQETIFEVIKGFMGLVAFQWLLLGFYAVIRRSSFEVETVAFFMCTMGMAVICSVKPHEAVKELIAIALGLMTFLAVGWSLRDLERAKKIRYFATVMGIGFLVITLLFGKEIHGAKNWLKIGGMTLQPSELSKVCFVFAGASTMDRLMNKRNIIMFIAYSVVICGLLALMNDFGTALIFFCAFLVIAYLRSGSVGTIGLACTSLGFAGVLALKVAPHAMKRFSRWRHIWEDPYVGGFQQTKAIMCIASGGFLGLGAGRGMLKNVFAADSDLAFATVSEEWGLLMGLMLVACIAALALFVLRSSLFARSSFYTIGACTAAGILLTQTILNCLGTVDVLPMTGVTFPFLSNGGSSMICVWGLLAFIKAADTRQNASFAVRWIHRKETVDE